MSKTKLFLHGGTDEEEDLKDTYIFELSKKCYNIFLTVKGDMIWIKHMLNIEKPLVGHSATNILRGLCPSRN